MAEYYPLLAKAVSTLEPEAHDARQAIYERARKALIGQLRSIVPQLPEAHIDAESRALDLAIARIEAENAVKAAIRGIAPPASLRPPVFTPRPPVMAPAAPALTPLHAPQAVVPPPVAPLAAAPRPVLPVLRPAPPLVAASPLPVPPRAPYAPPPPPVLPPAPVIMPIAAPDLLSDAAEPSASETALQAALADEKYVPVMRTPSASKLARKEPVRAPEPVKRERPPRNIRGLIVTLAIFLLVAAVAGAALWLKQSKEELARFAKPPVPTTEPADVPAPPPGKSGERVGGTAVATPATNPMPAPDQPITPVKVPTTTVRQAQQVAPATPIPVTDSPAPANPGGATIPVAHRAAILVDSPADQQRMKTYTGTVVWRVEQVKREGKPTATVLRAEIDIPAAKTQVTLTLQKNIDATLSASHLMDLRFTIAAGGDLPGVRAIKVPELRREETPAGDPLNGVPVPFAENVFTVGLTRGDAEARNIELLVSRNWIDVPILLSNEKLAKLTFEKGATGERAMNEALAAWK